jgi:hypothetical protein
MMLCVCVRKVFAVIVLTFLSLVSASLLTLVMCETWGPLT